jgi:hypothetical protein
MSAKLTLHLAVVCVIVDVHVVVDVDVIGFLKFMFFTDFQGELQGSNAAGRTGLNNL